MTRPDPAPTEARLFRLEANADAEIDAKALDAICLAIVEASSDERTITTRNLEADRYQVHGPMLRAILLAVQSTGREL